MTHAETNEAVALRLGYRFVERCDYRWDKPHWCHLGWQGEYLPSWSTNDGLAMELFKRLAECEARLGLCLEAALGQYRIVKDHDTIEDAEGWQPTISKAVTGAFIALVSLEEKP